MVIINAIYENGVLRPLAPLELPEHTRVRLSVESPVDDNRVDDDRVAWLAQSEHALMKAWDHSGDDVFNALLTP